jgi:hypothetical protein
VTNWFNLVNSFIFLCLSIGLLIITIKVALLIKEHFKESPLKDRRLNILLIVTFMTVYLVRTVYYSLRYSFDL